MMRRLFRLVLIIKCLLFSMYNNTDAQDQKVADSLVAVLGAHEELPDSVAAKILFNIAIRAVSPDDILKYANQLLKKCDSYRPAYCSIQAYTLKGVSHRLKGDINKSLENLFWSVEMSSNAGEFQLKEEALLEIASTYTANGDYNQALHFEKQALNIIRELGEPGQLALGLLNIGFSYYTLNMLDSALLLYDEAEPMFVDIGMEDGAAYLLGNRALVFWKQGNILKAEKDLLKSIDILTQYGDKHGMSDYHNQLGNLYFEKDDKNKAIYHTRLAFDMAKDLGLKEQVRDAVLLLSKLHKGHGNFERALYFQNQYMVYRDSIENTELTRKIAGLRTEYEVNLREKEIALLRERETINNIYILVAIILLIFSVVVLLYFRQRFRNTKLVADHDRRVHDGQIKDLMNTQETRTLRSMVEGRDNERKRLAKELHNHFGSLLATIKVNINGIEEDIIPNHDSLVSLVDQACTDMRNISHSLNLGVSENFGLEPALRELAGYLKHSRELEVELEVALNNAGLDSEHEILVYRIVQELISNVLKHAKATKLSIMLTLYNEEGMLNILVQDNGVGFDLRSKQRPSNGIGLGSLEEMVHQYDGEMNIDSHANSGTTVTIDLPVALAE